VVLLPGLTTKHSYFIAVDPVFRSYKSLVKKN
jgi:hypothetical protein